MSVAILYVCTGKYSVFWEEFYKSCNQFFLPKTGKRFFVFSDSLQLKNTSPDVELIYQKKLGWPYDTLMRFHLFSSIKEKLVKYDYVFFFNANILFQRPIDESIMKKGDAPVELIVVNHPFFIL